MPSGTRILPSVPSAVASTSAFTLADSISTRASPFATGSPSFLSHLTTWPSFMPMPHWGRRTSVGISVYLASGLPVLSRPFRTGAQAILLLPLFRAP